MPGTGERKCCSKTNTYSARDASERERSALSDTRNRRLAKADADSYRCKTDANAEDEGHTSGRSTKSNEIT